MAPVPHGLPLTNAARNPLLPRSQEDLKKKQRAERFGLKVPLSKEEFEAKKKERAERFGGGPAAEAMKSGMTEEHKKKLEERAKRFGMIAK